VLEEAVRGEVGEVFVSDGSGEEEVWVATGMRENEEGEGEGGNG
jgi:hypothetical protein